MGYKILGTLLLSLISAQALATNYVVLESDEICQFYQNPKGCYQQALQMISSVDNTGRIQNNAQECLFDNGDKVIFETDINWMFSLQMMKDLSFEIFKANGVRRLGFESKRDSFSISGPNSDGVELKMTFSNLNAVGASHHEVISTVRCDMNFGAEVVVYIMPTDNLYEASKTCPDLIDDSQAVPTVNYELAQAHSRIQVRPFIQRGSLQDAELFRCRNY